MIGRKHKPPSGLRRAPNGHTRRAEHTVRFFGTTRMLWTAPFAAFGLIRFFVLVQTPKGESPTEEILKDAPFMLNLLTWAATITLIIYFRGSF